MKLLNYTVLSILILTMAAGCTLMKKTRPKDIVCPPPPSQGCKPEAWRGLPMDTSEAYKKVADYYYIFEPVDQINSKEDEWGLSFISNRRAVLTFNDAGEQRTMLVRMVRENLAALEGGLGIPVDGSNGAVSFAGSTAVFSASLPSHMDIPGNSDIYLGEIQGNRLVNVYPMGDSIHFDHRTWESQPAVTPDGKVIFFASDRPYGVGGTDIWFTVKLSSGAWSSPVNCGEMINSRCDELTPFVTTDGKTLLFASAGHETVGGYDIFSAEIKESFRQAVNRGDIGELRRTESLFSAAVNLRAPLNTKWDELFPASPGDINELLYYSSNQSDNSTGYLTMSGGFDIYVRRKIMPYRLSKEKIEKKETEKLKADVKIDDNLKLTMPDSLNLPVFQLEGRVFEQTTSVPIPKASITIREIKPELASETELEITSQGKDIFFESMRLKSDEEGKYSVTLKKSVRYEITAQTNDLFFDSYKLNIDRDDTVSVVYKDFFIPEMLTLRINFPTDKYDDPYRYVLDSTGIETNRTWQEELDLLANNILSSGNRVSKIILVGHTDDVADVDYNERLGKNRVYFVIKELIRRGVSPELLEGRSAGELEPLPREKGENQEIYRKRLRRVELQKEFKKN